MRTFVGPRENTSRVNGGGPVAGDWSFGRARKCMARLGARSYTPDFQSQGSADVVERKISANAPGSPIGSPHDRFGPRASAHRQMPSRRRAGANSRHHLPGEMITCRQSAPRLTSLFDLIDLLLQESLMPVLELFRRRVARIESRVCTSVHRECLHRGRISFAGGARGAGKVPARTCGGGARFVNRVQAVPPHTGRAGVNALPHQALQGPFVVGK
jgi:hypothetical protein